MADKTKYKPFIYLFLIVVFIVFGAVLYNNIILKPNREIDNLKNQTKELKQNISNLENIVATNQTIIKTVEVTKQGGASGFFLLTTIILSIVLLIVLLNKKVGVVKNRDEIIKYMRKYSKEKDGVKLYQCLKYMEGYYKAEHTFPVALVVYSIYKGYHNQERSIFENRGFLVDRRNLDNVIEDFAGVSIKEIIETLKETTWGLRGLHYEPYKTKSYEEQAMKEFYGREEAIKEAVEFKKAVEDRV